jgi:SAM-dependent methyltransferase
VTVAIFPPARSQSFAARALTSLRLRGADLADSLTGRRDRLTPPRRMSLYVGHGDFRATGEEFLALFEQLAGLRPQDRVLDIGCGIGRMARALSGVLRPPGSYDGFDVAPSGIEWCRAHYHGTPAPFRFAHADLGNSVYNPGGPGDPASFRFPYADDSFDLAIATSVFTHLLPRAADHYLAEAARVLAPAGRLFCTWMLLDADGGPPGAFTTATEFLPAAVHDLSAPEAGVAYPETWVRERLDAHGLEPASVHHGHWRGGSGPTLQDVIVCRSEGTRS